jgi:hypothetical protein
MTARALHAAERRAEQAERAVIAARVAVNKASVRDGRLMGMLASNDPRRVAYEQATAAARQAEAKADEARKRVEEVRRQNGLKPSVARAELKAAVAAMRKAERTVANNLKAIERADTTAADAAARFEKAQAAIEKAKNTDTQAAVRAAQQGETPATSSVMYRARNIERFAEDGLAAAKAAHADLTARQPELESEVRYARDDLERAIRAVIASEAPVRRLIEQTARLQEQLVHKRVLLRHLTEGNLIEGYLIADEATREAAETLLRRELPAPQGERVQHEDWDEHPASLAWDKMLAKLATDADAELDVFS